VVAILSASFLGNGSDSVWNFFFFADNASQYNHYVTILMNSPGIMHGARLKIVDTPMSLISNTVTVILCSITVRYVSNNDY
jgi:hypothetical protein